MLLLANMFLNGNLLLRYELVNFGLPSNLHQKWHVFTKLKTLLDIFHCVLGGNSVNVVDTVWLMLG